MLDRKLFKCFDGRFLALCVAVSAVVIGLALVARGFERGSPVRVALALVQAAAMGVVIFGSVLLTRRLDELQFRIHLEALALAFAASATLVTAWGYLEHAGMPPIEWGLWAWPIMVVLWGAGLMVARRRYR